MARIYMERLRKSVIELSHGNDWDTAVVEWEIIDCEEDSTLKSSITFGQQKKIRAIIVASIRPYLQNQLAEKINH